MSGFTMIKPDLHVPQAQSWSTPPKNKRPSYCGLTQWTSALFQTPVFPSAFTPQKISSRSTYPSGSDRIILEYAQVFCLIKRRPTGSVVGTLQSHAEAMHDAHASILALRASALGTRTRSISGTCLHSSADACCASE